MFVSFQIQLLSLIPSVTVFEGGAVGRWLGHEAEVPMNRISPYKGDHRYLPFPFYYVITQQKNQPSNKAGGHSSSAVEFSSSLDLTVLYVSITNHYKSHSLEKQTLNHPDCSPGLLQTFGSMLGSAGCRTSYITLRHGSSVWTLSFRGKEDTNTHIHHEYLF